jgi:hypothetical protein
MIPTNGPTFCGAWPVRPIVAATYARTAMRIATITRNS